MAEGRAEDTDPTPSRLPSRRTALLLVGGTIALYAVGLAAFGVGDALPALTRAAATPLLGALTLEVLTIATLAMVHRASARAVGHRLAYRDALNVSMTAFTLTQSMPGGGAVAAAEVIRRLTRLGLAGPVATTSLALTATLTTSTIAMIGAGGVAVSFARGALQGYVLVGAALAVVILVGLFVALMLTIREPRLGIRLIRRVSRLHPWLAQRADGWTEAVERLSHMPPSTRDVVRVVGWSGVNWVADIAALWLLFVAFDQPVTIAMLLVGFAAAQLGAAIPITPGGTGFVEGGMVAGFLAVGVPLATATTIVVAYRVLATWMPTVAGLPALLRPPAADT